jgi:hypothetical protein
MWQKLGVGPLTKRLPKRLQMPGFSGGAALTAEMLIFAGVNEMSPLWGRAARMWRNWNQALTRFGLSQSVNL